MEMAAKLLDADGPSEGEEVDLSEVPEETSQTPKFSSERPESGSDADSVTDRSVYMNEEGEIIVDSQHPEILEAVQKGKNKFHINAKNINSKK